ncbi:hypothetical protein [Parafrankia sp. EUN1f]|uniref:hypothetical protein n=1 Tax=Parafrankia sp. EUN1f TaxID=102897 RepID=UPI0001C46382|nr:hypothetical protein [Parafrankia sp. EUN1f]EFC81411.1 hypothetical protein FrEUN1fDRAFT_5463 [Parafrankia sp. EUN1f]
MALAFALLGSGSGGAATADPGSRVGDPLCARPDNSALVGSPRLGAGYLKGEEWLAGEKGQEAVRALNSRLGREGARVLGAVPDHDRKRILVVIDSGGTSRDYMARLEADLARVAPAIHPQVRASCHPRGPLDEAVKRLVANTLGIRGSYGFTIDAATATIDLVTASPPEPARVRRALGDTTRVRQGRTAPFQGARTGDSSPHFGDAAIETPAGGCSSNFSYVRNTDGTPVAATAGHCGEGTWNSGANIVGTVVRNGLPAADAELLYAAGQSYTNTIHVTPGFPAVRTVVGKHDLTLNEYACLGGRTTLSDCGAWVSSTTYYQCYLEGCWNFIRLFRFSLPGDPICDHGDSGGVVYQKSGASSAIANGMINAGTVDLFGNPLYLFGGYDCWTTRISAIESALDVTLRTTP